MVVGRMHDTGAGLTRHTTRASQVSQELCISGLSSSDAVQIATNTCCMQQHVVTGVSWQTHCCQRRYQTIATAATNNAAMSCVCMYVTTHAADGLSPVLQSPFPQTLLALHLAEQQQQQLATTTY